MSTPGPAQLELIRRYARELREMHADAMRVRAAPAVRPQAGTLSSRPPGEPIRRAAKGLTGRSATQ